MADLVKCPVCNGRKRVLGAGMMEKECKPCLGIGWIEQVNEPEIGQSLQINLEDDVTDNSPEPLTKPLKKGKRKYTKRK